MRRTSTSRTPALRGDLSFVLLGVNLLTLHTRATVQEHWHSKVTPSAECVVRLTNVGNVRVAGNRFKLEAFTVRPGTYHMVEGLHQFGSERFNLVEQGLYTTKARA